MQGILGQTEILVMNVPPVNTKVQLGRQFAPCVLFVNTQAALLYSAIHRDRIALLVLLRQQEP